MGLISTFVPIIVNTISIYIAEYIVSYKTMKPNTLIMIPNDILLYIAEYIDNYKTLINLSLTNKTLYNIMSDSNGLWSKLYKQYFVEYV